MKKIFMARKRNKTSKASKSAQGDMFIEMMEVSTFGDNLENLMAISNPIDPEVMRILMENYTSIMAIIQPPENIMLMISDEPVIDIPVAEAFKFEPEVFLFEPEDFSFLLEK